VQSLRQQVNPPPGVYTPEFSLIITSKGCTNVNYNDTECSISCYQGNVRPRAHTA
jgi:hypothetical protein